MIGRIPTGDTVTPAFPHRHPLHKRHFISEHSEDYYAGWVYLFSEMTSWCREEPYPVDCYARFKDGKCTHLSLVYGYEPWDYGSPSPIANMADPLNYVFYIDNPTLYKVYLMTTLYENDHSKHELPYVFDLLYDVKTYEQVRRIANYEADCSDASPQDLVDLFIEEGMVVPECLSDVSPTRYIWIHENYTWTNDEPLPDEMRGYTKVKVV